MVAGGRSRRGSRLFGILAALLLAVGGVPALAVAQDSDNGVVALTGGIGLDADDIATYGVPLVILNDLSVQQGAPSGAISGDRPVPSIESQSAAGLTPGDDNEYDFSLALPIRPQGLPFDITGGGDSGDLPQVFSVDIIGNTAGNPLITELDTYSPATALASSLLTGADGSLRGQLAVWADGDGSSFPSSVGDDGIALTADDPVSDLSPGWTVVRLSDDDYTFDRDAEVGVRFPSGDAPGGDFSAQGWTEAFTSLIDTMEIEYPFDEYKDIDFDALRDEYIPMVEQAEQDDDVAAYTLAVYLYGLSFGDGHVSSSVPIDWLRENFLGGYGLTLGRADDGTVYVTSVSDSGPADDAGIEAGDTVEEWGGQPIQDAIDAAPIAISASSEFARTNQRVQTLARGAVGDSVDIGYTDGDGTSDTVTLRALEDSDGFVAALSPSFATNQAAMPIESQVLPSGVGYIRISTFATEIPLFTSQWDYAIRTMDALGVRDLVIDVRSNGGGDATLAFYASSTFTPDPFPLDTAFIADADGDFVDSGQEIAPSSPTQWNGDVAVLVDSDCASSCEQFAGTMAAIGSDDISIVGFTPSGGIYAAITGYSLPEGISFQAPYVRYENDGQIFLEGQGVQPDILVPVTEDTLLSDDDVLLDTALDALGG